MANQKGPPHTFHSHSIANCSTRNLIILLHLRDYSRPVPSCFTLVWLDHLAKSKASRPFTVLWTPTSITFYVPSILTKSPIPPLPFKSHSLCPLKLQGLWSANSPIFLRLFWNPFDPLLYESFLWYLSNGGSFLSHKLMQLRSKRKDQCFTCHHCPSNFFL